MSHPGLPASASDQTGEAAAEAQRQPPARTQARSWLFTLLKLALSALAISYVAFTVDLAAAWQHMANQTPWLLAAAVAALVAQVVLGGLRWNVIIRSLGIAAAAPDTLRVFYVGAFFSNWLWGGAVTGDAVRLWLFRHIRASTMTAISSIILDRVAAVSGVAVLVILTAPLFAERIGSTASALIPTAVALLGLVGIGLVAQLPLLPINWQRSRLLRGLAALSNGTRAVFLRPARALPVLALAAGAQLALSLAAFMLARSMDITLTLLDCVVLIQPIVLITALPISVGGWGVRETALIGLLALAGVPASAALALSVQLGILGMVAALPGLAIWLRLKRRIER